MSAHRRGFLFNAVLAAGALGSAGASAQQPQPVPPPAEPRKVWVCPPCGCDAHHLEFDKPGTCPACGMPLVEKTSAQDSRKKVAILVFDGVQPIDFAAPYEVFGQAGYAPFTVAARKALVTTAMQLGVMPAYAFADCPRPDILMVPGGNIGGPSRSPETLAWIKARSGEAATTMTVCNGAILAARAGILDGLKATTFYNAIEDMRREFPRVTVVSDQRFVDNGGKVITSAGLSAGIDAALHVVSNLSGPARAQLVALNMEYDWKAEGTYARAAFADYPLRQALGANLDLHLPGNVHGTLESTSGDRKVWNAVWRVDGAASPAEIAKGVELTIAARGGPTAQTPSPTRRAWRFVDNQSRTWRIQLSVTETGGVKRARMTSTLAA